MSRVTIGEIYVQRTGNTAAAVKEIMDAETWMGGAEAVEQGFATGIFGQDDEQVAEARALASKFNLRAFLHAPKFEAKTKRVDGEDLEKSAFAYQGGDEAKDWHLPIKFSTEEKTKSHIRDAISRWGQTDMPDKDEKAKARERILRGGEGHHGIDVDEDSLKAEASHASNGSPNANISVDQASAIARAARRSDARIVRMSPARPSAATAPTTKR